MLCPAAVLLLAVLGPGLSHSADDNSESGFTLCSQCFYRQTPPQRDPAGRLLHPLCHRLPGGQAFATLSRATCDTAVYSAFHLRHGWMERAGEVGEEPSTEEEDKVAVPALLRGGDPSHSVSPTDLPLQQWDLTVTTLVHSSISPQCSTLGGELYILTGAGGLRADEDEEEECPMKPLWLAMCCALPEGKGGFSMGLMSETGEGERQVSIKELEEMLGVEEMFSGGCGGAVATTVGVVTGLHSEANPENIEKMAVEALGEETGANDVTSDTADVDSEAPQETSAEEVKSAGGTEELGDVRRSADVRSESPESSADHENEDEQETDTHSSSTLVYILSTTMSILKAPLHPVVSTATRLPGQVTYVLQEDLGVLSGLPGETFSLLHLLTSDLLSWMGSAAGLVLGVGETCFSSVYYCTSSMLGELWNNCYTGVTGMGTLAGDTVGIFGDTLDNAWWVTKLFGGQLWEQSEGYVGSVMSEMGGQAKAAGGGLGKLLWRSVNGVYNVFRLGGGFIMGTIGVLTGAMREAFGQESE